MTAPPASSTREAPAGGATGAAFDLPGGPAAVLLLHGLTGTPFELRHLADRLHARGMRCRAPLLPGHGGDPRALAGVPWEAWVESARRELALLHGAQPTFVVGSSMGALVACVLAHASPDKVDGLALLAPALRLTGTARLAGFLARLTPLGEILPPIPKVGGSDVRDPVMRRENPTMPAVPLRAVGELLALARHVDALLPGIAAPALVVAGRRDHTVRLSGARRLARRIGSGPAKLVVLERSFHLVGIDVERDRCADEVVRFFETIPALEGDEEQGGAWQPT